MSVPLVGASRNQIARAASKYFNNHLGVHVNSKDITPVIKDFANDITSAAADVAIFKRSGKMTKDGKAIVKQFLRQENMDEKTSVVEFIKRIYKTIIAPPVTKQVQPLSEVPLFA